MPFKDPEKARTNARERARKYIARRTAKKVATFEKKIAERPSWPENDLAWAAGMFEGEGTITISGAGRVTRSVVCLSSTDREIVDFFQERWPGLLSTREPAAHHKRAWMWRLQGNFTLPFLADVAPFFRTRAERSKAALLVESQKMRWAGYKLQGHSEKMMKYRDRFRVLNQRGRKVEERV